MDDKQIKKAAIKYAEGRCQCSGEDECDYVVSRCIDRQLAAAFEAGAEWAISEPISEQWIKCSERMPEEGVSVLVRREKGDLHVSELYRGVWFNYCNSCMLVTDWMPLPKGLKE